MTGKMKSGVYNNHNEIDGLLLLSQIHESH